MFEKLKEIDYKKLYREKYRSYPSVVSTWTFISFVIASFVAFIGLASDDLAAIGFIVLLAGSFVGYIIAIIVGYSMAITMSQKIALTDAAIAIQEALKNGSVTTGDANTAEKEEELPEL